MDDLWEKLRDAYALDRVQTQEVAWRRVADYARELLAKPVATREEVRAEVNRFCWRWSRDDSHSFEKKTDLGLHLLTHFAPPRQRMMIEGMNYTEIRDAMVSECANAGGKMDEHDHEMTQWCARVAHRLATTPAPEVDLDAEAKKYLGMWMRVCHPNDAERSDEQIWNCYRQMHDAARSFAAGMKVVRG